MLRPTGYGSGSMLLHGHPVRCLAHPLGTVAKEMKKEDLQETHDHQVMLRADVKKLGKMLGYAISKHSGEGVFQKVRCDGFIFHHHVNIVIRFQDGCSLTWMYTYACTVDGFSDQACSIEGIRDVK